MGSWSVLNRFNPSNGVHYWPPGHRLRGVCDDGSGSCHYIVEEHQMNEPPTEVPEFDIEVFYFAPGSGASNESPGWKYALRWTDKLKRPRSAFVGGHATQAAAKQAAEARATEIAKTLLPTTRYTFRPTL